MTVEIPLTRGKVALVDDDQKTCRICGETKSRDSFYPRADSRDGLRSDCQTCTIARARSRVEADPPRRKAYQDRYYRENRDRLLAAHAAYREAQRPRVAETNRAYRERNRSRIRAVKQDYYQRNGDVIARIWARRARLFGAAGSLSRAEWDALVAAYGHRCLCCGKEPPGIKLTIDHVVPLALGGSHSPGNVQPLCASCNARKGKKATDYRPNAARLNFPEGA